MEKGKAYRFSRNELYAMVWREPVRTIARRLGLSDVGLAKACRKAEIPMPGLGHWAKKEAGKVVRIVPLSPRGLGKSDYVVTGGNRYGEEPRESDDELLAVTLPPAPTFDETDDALALRVDAVLKKAKVVSTLKNPHHEVAKLLDADQARREKYAQSEFSWDKPLFDAPAARRQLRVINGIFLALAKLGYRSSLRGSGPFELNSQIGDTGVSWRVEAAQPERRKGGTTAPRLRALVHFPQSCRSISADEWIDRPDQPLESVGIAIVRSIILAGEYNYQANVMHRYEWRVERRLELEAAIRRRAEDAERKRLEAIRRQQEVEEQDLLEEARRWRQAVDLRAYVAARLTSKHSVGTAEAEWARWAHAVADRIDPLGPSP